jgi:hypothetical protein
MDQSPHFSDAAVGGWGTGTGATGDLERLAPWIELLTICPDEDLRRRLLLEAALGLPGLATAALWIEMRGSSDTPRHWQQVCLRSLGTPGAQLSPAQACGPRDNILIQGSAPKRWALTWSPATAQTETESRRERTCDKSPGPCADRDLLQALLSLCAITESSFSHSELANGASLHHFHALNPSFKKLGEAHPAPQPPGAQDAPDTHNAPGAGDAPGAHSANCANGSHCAKGAHGPDATHGHQPAEPADSVAQRARHDLRNLLAGILATGELLAGRAGLLGPGERQRFKAILDHECRRAGELLAAGLIGGDRAEGQAPAGDLTGANGQPTTALPGTRQQSTTPTPPLHTVRETVSAQRPLFEAAAIDLELTCDLSGRLPRPRLGACDLSRILHNLLTNAREAFEGMGNAADPTVTIHLDAVHWRGADCLRLLVQDNGPGIPAELTDSIFQSGFSRGKRGGSGLGLAVVQDCVSEAAGRTTYSPRRAGGSRFEVLLPPSS